METPLYTDIELPLARVLFCMESTGFHVDPAALKQFGTQLDHMTNCENEFILQQDTNLIFCRQNSWRKYSLMNYNSLSAGKREVRTQKCWKSSAVFTRSWMTLEYRQVTKLKSTYVDGLLKAADGQGRVHTTFQQAVTATGRLSSTEPNLQNIPIRTDLGREMRRFFTTKSSGCADRRRLFSNRIALACRYFRR